MEKTKERRFFWVVIGGVLVFLLTMQGVQRTSAQVEPVPDFQPFGFATVEEEDAGQETEDTLANCRYGTTGGPATTLDHLGVGWWYLFNQPNWPGEFPQNNAEYVHIIKVFQEITPNGDYLPNWYPIVPMDDWLIDLISNNRGDIWGLGNEVDRGNAPGTYDPNLFGLYPEMYAEAYHDLYYFIKGVDPTARVAISGLVQVTPSRLQYLDMVWDA